jgi:hypothetical protein
MTLAVTVSGILSDPVLVWLLPGGAVLVLVIIALCGGGDLDL